MKKACKTIYLCSNKCCKVPWESSFTSEPIQRKDVQLLKGHPGNKQVKTPALTLTLILSLLVVTAFLLKIIIGFGLKFDKLF